MVSGSVDAHARESSLHRYGVDRWGEGFLTVNEAGHLEFGPPGKPRVDLHRLAVALGERGITAPFVLRFPSMIDAQMGRMRKAFDQARRENRYQGGYVGVYPLKVNQRRAVVEAIERGRERHGFGLEAGSKPELILAMSRPPVAGLPLLLNGFKDREFMRMAFHAAELGHEVIVVFESIREVQRFVEVHEEQEWKQVPCVGVRAKLYARGSGRWHGSGGEGAKFGLTTNEILAVIRKLVETDLADRLTLLHYHIGSQITQIKRIKQAAREGAHLYAALSSRVPSMHYLDLGGGIGVDYDGSRTSYPSSANYTVGEYARQVVYEVAEVVRRLGVDEPTLITESGRILVAHHAVVVADMRELQGDMLPVPEPASDEHRLIRALRETLEGINTKNYEEYVHDSVDLRDEALNLFSSGYLSLEERASAEALFGRVRLRAAELVKNVAHPAEDVLDFLAQANHKYLVNFSVFQSIPDVWSIGQVFPAAPLSRHAERPSILASVVDITCDSDGCVTTFAHPDENLKYLPMHAGGDEPYYLGFFMTGAYQDSLSNAHNLFSRDHEIVAVDGDFGPSEGTERIELEGGLSVDVRRGGTCGRVLSDMDYTAQSLLQALRERHEGAATTFGESWAADLLGTYPYLGR